MQIQAIKGIPFLCVLYMAKIAKKIFDRFNLQSKNKDAMKQAIQTREYNNLVNEITALYDVARHALVEAYWQIDKRIVDEEQHGQAQAVYGDHLLDRLSQDLSATLESGFSKRNLYKIRQFYLAHKIVPPAAQFMWNYCPLRRRPNGKGWNA